MAEDKAEILSSKMVWTMQVREKKQIRCLRQVYCEAPDLIAGGATAVALRAAVRVARQDSFFCSTRCLACSPVAKEQDPRPHHL